MNAPQAPGQPILFLHVPKTAGTATARLLEECYPGELFYDYGTERNRETARSVSPFFARNLESIRCHYRMIYGHYHYLKYAALFPNARVVSVVRDPVDRAVSHYYHAARYRDAEVLPQALKVQSGEWDLVDFTLESGLSAGIYQEYFEGIDPEQVELFLVQERLNESLAIMAGKLGLRVLAARLAGLPDIPMVNERIETIPAGVCEVTPSQRMELKRILAEDIEFFGKAASLAFCPSNKKWLTPGSVEGDDSVVMIQANHTGDLRSHFKDVPDETWKDLVIRSISEKDIDGVRFPNYTHNSILGSATAESGAEEAFQLYKLCKPFMEQHMPDRSKAGYLDFGCGVGRIFRMFLRDFERENAIGVDCMNDFVEICKADFEGYRFQTIPDRPPVEIPDASVDVITSYSVFSHFSAIQNTRWIDEFARIMRPGGLAFLTTYGQGHLDYLKTYDEAGMSPGHVSQKRRVENVGGFDEIKRLMSLGDMMYFVGGGNSYRPYDYGWAYIGPEFVNRAWGRDFEVLAFIDDYQKLEQALVVLKRKP